MENDYLFSYKRRGRPRLQPRAAISLAAIQTISNRSTIAPSGRISYIARQISVINLSAFIIDIELSHNWLFLNNRTCPCLSTSYYGFQCGRFPRCHGPAPFRPNARPGRDCSVNWTVSGERLRPDTVSQTRVFHKCLPLSCQDFTQNAASYAHKIHTQIFCR